MADKGKPSFRVVPAGRGLAWLLAAGVLIRTQTVRLLTVALIVQLIMSLTRFPVVGLMVALAIPIISAGMLQCFHQVRKGVPLSPMEVFKPFSRTHLAMRLFLLGAIAGFLALLLVSWLLSGVEQLKDPELLSRLEQGDISTVLSLDPAVVYRVLLAIAIGIAVSGTMAYFAVPLVWFKSMPIGAAIALGLKALVKNWLPFVVLGLVLTGLSIPVFLILGVVVGLLAVTGGSPTVQYLAFMFIALVVQLLMFGTQYCAFSEIFQLGDRGDSEDRADEDEPDNQLIA